MAKTTSYPIGERVASLEVEVKEARKGFEALADTVRISTDELKREIRAASLNGQRDTVIAMARDFGDAESREVIRSLIRNRDRREWLARPVVRYVGALLVGGTGALVGYFLHH